MSDEDDANCDVEASLVVLVMLELDEAAVCRMRCDWSVFRVVSNFFDCDEARSLCVLFLPLSPRPRTKWFRLSLVSYAASLDLQEHGAICRTEVSGPDPAGLSHACDVR